MATKKPLKTRKKYTHADSLRPEKNTKVRREFIDYDYTKELSEDELAFLAKFNNEYYGAAISKNPETGRVKAGHLHRKKADVKDIYDDNNRRNNDVYGVTRSNHLLYDIVTETNANDGWYITNEALTEAAAVSSLDAIDETEDILSFEEYQELKHNMSMEMQLVYEIIYGDRKE